MDLNNTHFHKGKHIVTISAPYKDVKLINIFTKEKDDLNIYKNDIRFYSILCK